VRNDPHKSAFRNVNLWIFLILLIFSFVSFSLKGSMKVYLVKNVSALILYPFGKVISVSRNIFSAQSKNLKLKKEIVNLRIEIQRCVNIKRENELLREYYGFKQLANFELFACEIIGKSPGLYNKTFIVDRGLHKGIRRNMTAVAANGLVGRVLESTNITSEVLTLYNRDSFVSAIDLRSRVQGIIGWRKGTHLILDNVALHSDVKEGDTLVTSGMGSVFPKGIFIARIISVEENPEKIVMDIQAEPFVDFSLLENVFIIKECEHSSVGTFSEKESKERVWVKMDMFSSFPRSRRPFPHYPPLNLKLGKYVHLRNEDTLRE